MRAPTCRLVTAELRSPLAFFCDVCRSALRQETAAVLHYLYIPWAWYQLPPESPRKKRFSNFLLEELLSRCRPSFADRLRLAHVLNTSLVTRVALSMGKKSCLIFCFSLRNNEFSFGLKQRRKIATLAISSLLCRINDDNSGIAGRDSPISDICSTK